jgi:RNA polymerase sigma-70 factor (ECF subfamily)
VISNEERVEREQRIRTLCDAGKKKQAATLLLETYGREILGFLMSRLRDRDAVHEVYSRFTEDLWRGLDGFRWQCSARVWSYTLARHAMSRYVQEARRRRIRQVPLSVAEPISAVAEKIRTETLASARTESKSRIAILRERLPADDQTLLILRVNRRLAWTEIAQIMFHEGETVEQVLLEKDAIRLRKRYQSAKDRLRKMALAEGLIQTPGDR